MNQLFSFDSNLSAMALSSHLMFMTNAMMVGGPFIIEIANDVSEFLNRRRMDKVLWPFIMGVLLVPEGGTSGPGPIAWR